MKKDRSIISYRKNFRDSIFMHESQCFICLREAGQDGPLHFCHFCTRSYHIHCANFEVNEHQQKICPSCQGNRKCEFCQIEPTDKESTLLCTLCLLPAHETCYWTAKGINEGLTQQERECLLFGKKSYVCRSCLLRNGIYQIKKIQRLCSLKNFEAEQKIISLIQIRSKSPIHFGWFTELDVRKSFAQQKQSPFFSKKFQEKRYFNPKYLKTKPKIQKIISIRVPQQQQMTSLQILNLIRSKERDLTLKFGDVKNFKFLVKWEKSEYESSSWQDEFVVKILDKSNFFIEKYLYQNLGDLGLDKYGFIDSKEKDRLLDDSEADEIIFKMAKLRWRHPIQIIINEQGFESALLICKYLNQLYILERQQYPTVVIVPEGKLLQWEEALTTLSRNINIVCLIGNSKSHGLIRTIEFNHNNGSPKFDVLLLSYEMFRKERERDYLLYYITHSAIYMCIDFEDPTFINSFHSQGLADHLIFVLNRVINNPNIQNQKTKKICNYFHKNLILKHTMTWSQIEVITVKKNPQEELGIQLQKGQSQEARVIKMEPLPELKRVAFLLYVLIYGIEVDKADQIHRKMLVKCREIYDLSFSSAIQLFKVYIRGFFSVMTHYKEFEVPKETLNYYFFDLDPESVIKRVLQLNRLREVLKISDYEFNISPMEEENAQQDIIILKSWNNLDDRILGSLILEQGFGNWEKIEKNEDWQQYSLTNNEKISFEKYLDIKSALEKQQPFDSMAFIRQRADLILRRLSSGL